MFTFSILITIALNLWKKEEDPTEAGDSGVGIFLVVSTLSFVVFFALGPGSIPWMITSELFTQGPRPAAIAVATLVNWIANLLVGFTFPVMVSGLQAQGYNLVELVLRNSIFTWCKVSRSISESLLTFLEKFPIT